MKNFHNLLLGLSSAAIISTCGVALANESADPTFDATAKTEETSVRCFYQTNYGGIVPGFNYIWAIDPNSIRESKYYIKGKWTSGFGIIANMFYTETTREEVLSACDYTLRKRNISDSILMYAAADSGPSFNYSIWHLDPVRQSGKINKIVVFGDSLSDTQNFYNGTDGTLPTPKNYFAGRFSNGKIWIDYLSEAMNLPVYNWAVAGAESGSQYEGILKGIKAQVKSWAKYTKPSLAANYRPENTLFTLEIGANDLLDGSRTPDKIIFKMREAIDLIVANNGKHIMLMNLPDLSLTPLFQLKSAEKRKKIQDQVREYNTRMANMVEDLRILHRDLNIQIYDTMTLMSHVREHKEQYQIQNTVHSCLEIDSSSKLSYLTPHKQRPECANAPNGSDSFAFWDLIHPTTHTYQILADNIYGFIQKKYGFFLDDK